MHGRQRQRFAQDKTTKWEKKVYETKMTTFIKTKFKISNLESTSNFQVNEKKIYSNRSRNNKIGLLWSGQSFGESTISDLESPSNFQVREKKNIEIGQETMKLYLN